MGRIKSWNKWANAHTYLPIDILRICLGICLFIKGIDFIYLDGRDVVRHKLVSNIIDAYNKSDEQ